ncbi:glycosyltransferase family 4 protein [Thermodesulfobacteriota bacterium]
MKEVQGISSSDPDMIKGKGQNANHINNFSPVEPLRVAILGSFPPLRALSSYCLELSLALSKLGKIEFISFKKIYPAFFYPGGDLRDDYSFPEIRHPNLKVWRRLTWYNPFSWIFEGLFRNADILHLQWWSIPLIFVYLSVCIVFKLRKKTIVCTIHNIHQHDRSALNDLLSRILYGLCDHFIVHSMENRKKLLGNNKIAPDKVTMIPHGAFDFLVDDNISREEVRSGMGFNASNKVILLFGTIRPYKGIDTSLKAFAKVIKKIPNARLIIAGKLWEDWGPYESLIADLNISEYMRTVLQYIPSEKVGKFFKTSDLVILPYHHFDAQSGVGATAIAFHKPMIVTDTGGLPELVLDPRNVVPPKDVDALANEIISCLRDSDRLDQMSKDAEKVATTISWSAIAEKTWSVYRKVLASKSV